MSALANLLPTTIAAPRTLLRVLRPVKPKRLNRVPFILVLALVLGIGMAGLLVLNTTIQDQSVRLRNLQIEAQILGYREANLQSQVNQLRSSAELAQRASALGMRPNPHPAFLEVPSGRVLGTPYAVTGNEIPTQVAPLPPPPPAPVVEAPPAPPAEPAPAPAPAEPAAEAPAAPPADAPAPVEAPAEAPAAANPPPAEGGAA